jgi:hypothetical protein
MLNNINDRLSKIENNIAILSEQLLILNDALTTLEIQLEIQSIKKVDHENII